MDEMPMQDPMVGDRVRVVMTPHEPGHDTGTVRQVCCGALGIEFDSAPGLVHHWYVSAEVAVVGVSDKPMGMAPATPPEDADMLAPPALHVPLFPRLSEYLGLWAIDPKSFQGLWQLHARADLVAHVARQAVTPLPVVSKTEMLPAAGGRNLAFVPLVGTLMKQQPSFGGTSTIQARRDVRQAAADPNVAAILLGIESPGGTVAGVEDLADDVRAARRKKPVWAHIDDMGASAAYWVASQADQVFVNNETALVGSIGTLLTIYDSAGAAEKGGVKALVFGTGPLKGAGTDGAAVTEEQRSYFQGIVNGTQVEFDRAVLRGRNLTGRQLADVRTGGLFLAAEALDRKLIDGIRSLDKTREALAASLGQPTRARTAATLPTIRRSLPMRGRGTERHA